MLINKRFSLRLLPARREIHFRDDSQTHRQSYCMSWQTQ